jgi:hypothetical protein
MASISAHIKQLEATIEPLTAELDSERKKGKELANRAAACTKDAALERETSATMRRQYENKLKVTDYDEIYTMSSHASVLFGSNFLYL